MLQNCRRQVWNWYETVLGTKSSFTKRQKTGYVLLAGGVTVFFALFFYRSFEAIPFMLPIGIFYLIKQERKKAEEIRERLRQEFKDAILTIAANLRAGYAVENAFRETMQEMKMLHGKEALIYQEFYKIVQGMANNLSIEYLIEQFADRSNIEEIQEFANIFCIAKRSGGNLTEIINETAAVISERIEVEKEIQVLLAEKKLEQSIMGMIPFAIILYVSIASAGYFDALYEAWAGRIFMTACLVIYMTACFLGDKITEIQI